MNFSSIKHWNNITRVLITSSTKPNQKTTLSFVGKVIVSGPFIQKKVTGPLHIIKTNGTISIYNQDEVITTKAQKIIISPIYSQNVIRLGTNSYRGFFQIISKPEGTLLFVNHVPSEDYLRGVIPSEMPANNKDVLEALKAQAVAARTYLLSRFEDPRNEYFDIFRDTRDQVYKGIKVETFLGDKAIFETQKVVALYNGAPINSYYFSTCGGHTANIEDMWGGPSIPYLRSRPDLNTNGQAFCRASKRFKWEEIWKKSELISILNQYLYSSNATLNNHAHTKTNFKPFQKLYHIKITKKAPSGRVHTLEIKTDQGNYHVYGDKVRWALRRNKPGYPILWSSYIKKISFGKTIQISGKGFGHGIGMCQMGAMGRARSGYNYKSILYAYYSNIRLTKIQN